MYNKKKVMSESTFTQIVFYYYAVGFLVAILLDASIRTLNSSEPFTFREFISTVMLWPFALISFFSKFFK